MAVIRMIYLCSMSKVRYSVAHLMLTADITHERLNNYYRGIVEQKMQLSILDLVILKIFILNKYLCHRLEYIIIGNRRNSFPKASFNGDPRKM